MARALYGSPLWSAEVSCTTGHDTSLLGPGRSSENWEKPPKATRIQKLKNFREIKKGFKGNQRMPKTLLLLVPHFFVDFACQFWHVSVHSISIIWTAMTSWSPLLHSPTARSWPLEASNISRKFRRRCQMRQEKELCGYLDGARVSWHKWHLFWDDVSDEATVERNHLGWNVTSYMAAGTHPFFGHLWWLALSFWDED